MKVLELDLKPGESKDDCKMLVQPINAATAELMQDGLVNWLSVLIEANFKLAKKQNLKLRGIQVKLILEDDNEIKG